MVTSEDVYAGTNKTSVWYFRAFQDIMRRKFKAGVTEAPSTLGKIFPDPSLKKMAEYVVYNWSIF